MSYRFRRFLVLVLLSVMVGACATTPPAQAPKSEHVLTATRFLHSWGAGEVVLTMFNRSLEADAKKQPGMAELTRRAFADVGADDFEEMVALVYARHLSQEHLAELARFTESPAGNRFFRAVIARVMEGELLDDGELMRQFNADELTEILKVSNGDAFAAMTQALPTINSELADEARRFGEATMREYLKRQ